VRPFPSVDGKWQLADTISREPQWAPDGRRLYYRTREGHKYVDLDLTAGFRAGRPQLLRAGGLGSPFSSTFSVGRDGRLLTLQPSKAEERDWSIHVLLGWRRELEELLGTER
jgi:hypothetical protein